MPAAAAFPPPSSTVGHPPPPPFNAAPQSASDVVLKNYDPPPNVAPPPKASAATNFRLGSGTLGQRVHHGGLEGGSGGLSHAPPPAKVFPPLAPLPASQSVGAGLSAAGTTAPFDSGLFNVNNSSSVPTTPMAPAVAPPSAGYVPPAMAPPPVASATAPEVAGPGAAPTQTYVPVSHHWFYCKQVENKKLWQPFTWVDSMGLEEAFNEVACEEEDEDLGPLIVSTDGKTGGN